MSIKTAEQGWGGSSGTVPAKQDQGPEFKLQYY
jgi:hypothetical protein